jgi:inhibitor of cysteine peptidase
MLVIDQSRNGGAVEIRAGETFRIELFENPTTGYRWHLVPPADAGLRVLEDSFGASQDKRGAGGVRHWMFSADHPAVVKLRIELKRAWETQAAEVFTVTINVKGR